MKNSVIPSWILEMGVQGTINILKLRIDSEENTDLRNFYKRALKVIRSNQSNFEKIANGEVQSNGWL